MIADPQQRTTGGLHRFPFPVPIYNEPGWLFSENLFISKDHFTCNGSGKELLNSTRSLGTAYQASQAIYSPAEQYRKVKQCNHQWWASKLFFYSPQIANQQILGLFQLSQICKFLRCARSQIANPQILWLIRKLLICKLLQNTAVFCLKTVLKVIFLYDFLLCTYLNKNIICHICKKKKYVFADLRKF